MSKIYKPKKRLKTTDIYKSEPAIAAEMIKKIREMGFKFKLVLTDNLYGESECNFISSLCELELDFLVAIALACRHKVGYRSNHGVWLPKRRKLRYNRWRTYDLVFSDDKQEKRYFREIVFGKRHSIQYWQVTTDIATLPDNSTWYLMSKIPGVKYKDIGNLYGYRNWVEYGLKKSKNELGQILG